MTKLEQWITALVLTAVPIGLSAVILYEIGNEDITSNIFIILLICFILGTLLISCIIFIRRIDMKIKEIAYELAEIICKRQLEKHDYSEKACETCPLYFKDEHSACGKTFARLNKIYGNKEIKKEYEE